MTQCVRLPMGLTSVVRLPAAVSGPRESLLTQILSSWQPRPLAHSEYYHASLTPTLLSTSTYKSNTTRLRTDWREQELYNFHDNNIHPRLHCLSLFLLKTSCVRVVDNAADAAVPLTPPWCHLGSLQHGDWRLQSNECAACLDCSSAACRVSLSCQGRFNSPRLVTTSGVMT